jgi:hypothetical protein
LDIVVDRRFPYLLSLIQFWLLLLLGVKLRVLLTQVFFTLQHTAHHFNIYLPVYSPQLWLLE